MFEKTSLETEDYFFLKSSLIIIGKQKSESAEFLISYEGWIQ